MNHVSSTGIINRKNFSTNFGTGELTFPEVMSVLLKCLPRPRLGVLHIIPLVISDLDNARDLIEIDLKKDNCFYNCPPMGLSPLISISKSNSVIVYNCSTSESQSAVPIKSSLQS